MDFKKFTVQFLCLANLISISLGGFNPNLSPLELDRSTNTIRQDVYSSNLYHSSYQPNNFKSFSPGTDFLSHIFKNTSCQASYTYKVDYYIINWCVAILGISLITSNIGFLFHFIWFKSYKDDRLKGKEENLDASHKPKTESHSLPITSDVKVFTFADLEAATFGFLEETRFAKGGYSLVYRGCFPDGSEIAIKRSKKINNKTDLYFQIELSFLCAVRHDNLLNLLGYSTDNNERMLVFNYMTNGSLYEHLYETKFRPECPFHTWRLRIKILLDCARGIESLHMHDIRGIIHRDVKPPNILLDENWNARISDLGLALVGPKPGSKGIYLEGVAGTTGYIDPEYEATNNITLKSDVYSFGVVILEMLTAKGAYFTDADVSYADYIAPKIIAGEIIKHVDRRPKFQAGVDANAVELIGKLAERCVRRSSVMRPTMRQVVHEITDVLMLYR